MPVHIGKLIEQSLRNRGITKSELARQLKCHPSRISVILKTKSLGTDLLSQISKKLDTDLFQPYREKLQIEPASSVPNVKAARDHAEIVNEISALREEISALERQNNYLKELITLQGGAKQLRSGNKSHLRMKNLA